MRSERKTPHWTDARPDARVLNAEPRSLSVRYGATDTLRSLKSVPGRVVEYVGVAGDRILEAEAESQQTVPEFFKETFVPIPPPEARGGKDLDLEHGNHPFPSGKKINTHY